MNIGEFFQDTTGAKSMSRLTMLGAFIVASIIMLWITQDGKMNEGYFGMFLATFAGAYLTSKKLDNANVPPTTAP